MTPDHLRILPLPLRIRCDNCSKTCALTGDDDPAAARFAEKHRRCPPKRTKLAVGQINR